MTCLQISAPWRTRAFRPSSSFCPLPVLGSPHKAFSFSSPFSSPYVVPRLLSVTASGEAEEKEFTDFFAEASPQLQKVVKDHLSIFLPPDRDPPIVACATISTCRLTQFLQQGQHTRLALPNKQLFMSR